MTVAKTYLMYIVVLLLFDLLLRLGRRSKPDRTNLLLKGDKGHSCNAKQKIVRNTEERRQDTRTSIVWPIKMKTSQGVISAGIKDISIESAFIVCQNPLPLKKQFRIAIGIPNQKPIALTVEVVWSNSNVSEDKVLSRGMRIKFLQSTEKVRESLNNAIHIYQKE
jgi:hypothetical protein